jgi:hypothetical protein
VVGYAGVARAGSDKSTRRETLPSVEYRQHYCLLQVHYTQEYQKRVQLRSCCKYKKKHLELSTDKSIPVATTSRSTWSKYQGEYRRKYNKEQLELVQTATRT